MPDEVKVRNARSNELALPLTGMDVAANGDIYVADGYASDNIHRFDRTGKYLESFGGKKRPYSFSTLHKLAIDTRYQPARLIGVDRANDRVVHFSLDRRIPRRGRHGSAAAGRRSAIAGDQAIIGELSGRVTVLDKAGQVVARSAPIPARSGHQSGQAGGSGRPASWSRRTASRSTRAATCSSPN